MSSNSLKKIAFMSQSQYASATKSKDTLYMVEYRPDLTTSPNYNSGIGIAANTTYTIGSGALASYTAGWFRIGFTSASWHGQQPQLIITINGQNFYASYGCAFTMVYLTSGNTFKTNSVQSNVNARFFPVKTS